MATASAPSGLDAGWAREAEHFHHEHNHQGKGTVLRFPAAAKTQIVKARFSVANGSWGS